MSAAALQNDTGNIVSLDQYRRKRLNRETPRVSPEVGEIAPFVFVWMPFWYMPVMFPAVSAQEPK